jgi:Zn finger protein HypA/HybF (possibly regulating hydrogenase expression)
MHEMGIVVQIVKRLEQAASDNGVNKISSVTMELGEVSGIVDYYLLDCWKWAASKSELLDGCKMEIEVLPAVTLCNDCGKTYGTVEHGRVCPYCGSENTVLEKGNEINIKDMTCL